VALDGDRQGATASKEQTKSMKAKPNDKPKSKPRRECKRLAVAVNPEEAAKIEALARTTELSVSAYLRRLGMGFTPVTIVDNEVYLQLLREGADLRRYGGLLKMWLTDDVRLRAHGEAKVRGYISRLMARTDAITAEIHELTKRLVPMRDD
jgi:hypothetical protein